MQERSTYFQTDLEIEIIEMLKDVIGGTIRTVLHTKTL